MNKHHREEMEMKHHGRHRESHKKSVKHMKDGGRSLLGEHPHKDSGYDHSDWKRVEDAVTGKHPTTHLAMLKHGGRPSDKHVYKDMMGGKHHKEAHRGHEDKISLKKRYVRDGVDEKIKVKRMAAGGVGKIRHEAYD